MEDIMFKPEDLEQFNSLSYRTKYINILINKVVGDCQLSDIDKLYIQGLAGEYINSQSGRASCKCLAKVLLELTKLTDGSGKKDSDSGLLKV